MKILRNGIVLNLFGFLIVSLIIINLFLTTLPLTNTLGYEYSVINGLLLFLFCGFLGIKLFKQENEGKFIAFFLKKKATFIILLTIPFIISLISSFIVSKCPITNGILFYLTITIPAGFFGLATGFFSVAISKKYSLMIFPLVFLLILFSVLLEFYINPQIYFYNVIFGFYPGTIYDEDLSVDRILVAYRIFNIAFFIGLVSISEHLRGKSKSYKFLSSGVLVSVILCFSFLKPILQFATDSKRLNDNLSKSIITDSFKIHFPPTMNDEKTEYAAILHEYYLDQLKIELKMKPSHKIDSYVFDSRNLKRVLLGAGNADIAKPWLNQIYLNFSNYDETLKHELVHIMSGEFGVTPLNVADGLNPSMIEGFAMAIENNYDGLPVHYMAKLAYQAGYKFSIDKLFSGFNFFTKNSSVSYVYSGSFIKYLSDKYGIDKIKILYGKSDFTEIYGKDIYTLAVEYDKFLRDYQIDFNKFKAQLYFGGMTIFKKFCPRVAASDVKKGWELFNNKNISKALEIFQKVFAYSNSYQSLTGIIACYSKEKKYVDAKKFLSKQLPNFKLSPYNFYLELAYGDILIKCDDKVEAVGIYDSLVTQNPHIQYRNEVMIRKAILNEGIDSLKNYFEKNETQRYLKLLKMNDNEINYYSIPSLMRSAERLDLKTKILFDGLKKRIEVTDQTTKYAALEISKLALKKSDYETAQYFAVLATKYGQGDDQNHESIENLRMVNWFKNSAEELKLTFRYAQ